MEKSKKEIISKLEEYLRNYIDLYSYSSQDNYLSKYIHYEDIIDYLLESYKNQEDTIKNIILNYEYKNDLLGDYKIENDKNSKVFIIKENY